MPILGYDQGFHFHWLGNIDKKLLSKRGNDHLEEREGMWEERMDEKIKRTKEREMHADRPAEAERAQLYDPLSSELEKQHEEERHNRHARKEVSGVMEVESRRRKDWESVG